MSDLDLVDSNLGEPLAVYLLLAVALPALPLEDDHLVTAAMAEHLRLDRSSVDGWGTDLDGFVTEGSGFRSAGGPNQVWINQGGSQAVPTWTFPIYIDG